eukprot:6193892-Pleurochrysis_carterae.AAC.1
MIPGEAELAWRHEEGAEGLHVAHLVSAAVELRGYLRAALVSLVSVLLVLCPRLPERYLLL